MRIVQRADSRSVSPCPTTIPNEVKLSALLARKPTRCWEIDTRDSTSDIDDFLQRPQGVLEYWKDLANNNEKLVQNLDPKETTASPSHRWTIGEQKLNIFKRIGKYFRACRSNTQQRKDGMPTELELRSRRKAPMRVATLGETISQQQTELKKIKAQNVELPEEVHALQGKIDNYSASLPSTLSWASIAAGQKTTSSGTSSITGDG